MEEQKPKSIRTIGLIISIFSGFIIFSNRMGALASSTAGQQEMEIFSVGAIINAVFWSTPIGLLIWFLNREKMKKHFE
ncbi:hypothetical protein FQZ97_1047090 [compost metagenome]